MVEYEVKIFYAQKSPDNTKQYEGYRTTLITCFGEPTSVRNLKAQIDIDGVLFITWDKPEVMNAPNICYYEVLVTEKDNPSKLVCYFFKVFLVFFSINFLYFK